MIAEQSKSIEQLRAAEQYARIADAATGEWPRSWKIRFLLGSSLTLWALIFGVVFLVF